MFTELFKMIVGVLTTCHTQYTLDRNICIFYLIEKPSKSLFHTLQVLYMCTLCDSTNTNTITELVPNCLWHVSSDSFNGCSDSYHQFRDTHASCLLKLHTTFEWNCQMVVVSRIWCGIAAGQFYPDSHFEQPCITTSLYINL